MTAYLPNPHNSPIWADIAEERHRQDEKWGDQSSHTLPLWMTILMEEVGEAAREVLHLNQNWSGDPQYMGDECSRLRYELIQVAAAAIATVEVLDE